MVKHTILSIGVIGVLSAAAGLLYCYFNFQFWTHYKTDNFKTLSEYRGQHIRGLFGRQILVNKAFLPYLSRVELYAKEQDILILVNQGYRYEGHEVGRSIVTPARYSNHLAGFAIDFNIKLQGKKYFAASLKKNNLKNLPVKIRNFIDRIRKDKDLRWGGDFQTSDPIHIDVPINTINKNMWNLHKSMCDQDFEKRTFKWRFW